MNDIRIIKKYPNRRLYDTNVSRYITLEEVRQLVLGNIRFRVEDKRTREDITRTILLQVISEQEEGGDAIFSSELLTHIIRLYGDPMQTSISRYLELSMHLFVEQQSHFSEQLRNLLSPATTQPIQRIKELADRQVPIWRSVRKEFLKSLSRAKAISPLRERDGS